MFVFSSPGTQILKIITVTIFFLGPVFTCLLSHFVLHDGLSLLEIVATLTSFVGVTLVAKPETLFHVAASSAGTNDAVSKSIGVVLAISAAVLSAVAYTIVRSLGAQVHFMLHVFTLGLTATVFSTIIFWRALPQSFVAAWHNPSVAILLVAQGAAAFFGQCALNKALQHCRGVGIMIRNLDVPLSYAFGIVLLREIPSWTSNLGALLVLCAVGAITFKQSIRVR